MPKGNIGSIIETKDIVSNNENGTYNCVKLSDGYYMMAFNDNDSDGRIATFAIDEATGNIGSTIDTWEFANADTTRAVKLIKISGTMYAITYSRVQAANNFYVKTFTVSDVGVITKSFIEGYPIPTTNQRPQLPTDIIHISGDVYAIVYTEDSAGSGSLGMVITVTITSAGVIGRPMVDSLQFTSVSRDAVSIVKVGTTDFYAISYIDTNRDPVVVTVDIDSAGSIAGAVTDTQVLANVTATNMGNILRVPGIDYYAVVVGLTGTSGTIYTCSINSSGAITNGSNGDFDAADAEHCHMVSLGGDAFLIAYRGVDNDGFLVSITIDSAGAVGSVIESLEFKTSDINFPFILYLGFGNYAITYGAVTEDDVECFTVGVITGIVFPSEAITRVTNLIHRYNRKEGIYELEMNLGEVTSDFGLPEWASSPRGLEQKDKLKWEEEMKRTIDDIRSYGFIPTPGQAQRPSPIGLGPLGQAAREEQIFIAPERAPAPSRPSVSEWGRQVVFSGFTRPGEPAISDKVTEQRPVTDVQPGILDMTLRMFRLRRARPVSIEEEKAKFERLRGGPKPKPVGISESIKRLMRFR